jgi:putative addiction module CopG family antidote
MSTLSVPLPADLEKFVEKMVKTGRAANKADVVRKALIRLSEDEAVEAILLVEHEPNLKGNLRELMKKI